GNHKNKICKPHFIPDFFHSSALKGISLPVAFIEVAGSSPEPYHGIAFLHFEITAPYKACIFIGLEIAHTDYNRLRIESRSNSPNSLSKLFDKVIFFPVALSKLFNFLKDFRVFDLLRVHKRHRMDLYIACNDEFKPRKPYPVVWDHGKTK